MKYAIRIEVPVWDCYGSILGSFDTIEEANALIDRIVKQFQYDMNPLGTLDDTKDQMDDTFRLIILKDGDRELGRIELNRLRDPFEFEFTYDS